jgi:plastocyanin
MNMKKLALVGAAAVALAVAGLAGGATTLKLNADPSNKLAFNKKLLLAKPGKVTIVMSNPSILPHDIAIKTQQGKRLGTKGKIVLKGGVSTATAVLTAGRYVFYCTVPGHEKAGMRGTLVVK